MRVLALFVFGVLSLVAQADRAVVTDLDGRRVEPLDPADGARATALIFMRADCPLAGQTAPEIERVVASAGRDGRVWLVYVDGADPVERIRTHVAEYGLTARVVRDPDHVLVSRAGVHVTPEAALYVHDKGETRLVYRGRLDDRVVGPGRTRPHPTRFDLREAMALSLAGRSPSLVTTPAFGCEIADVR